MGKIIFIILLFLSVAGCSSPTTEGSDETKRIGDFTIKTIDGCEYIELDQGMFDGRVYAITHKGNCKNHTKP